MTALFGCLADRAPLGIGNMPTASFGNERATVDAVFATVSAVSAALDRGNAQLHFAFRMGLSQIEHIGVFFHRFLTCARETKPEYVPAR